MFMTELAGDLVELYNPGEIPLAPRPLYITGERGVEHVMEISDCDITIDGRLCGLSPDEMEIVERLLELPTHYLLTDDILFTGFREGLGEPSRRATLSKAMSSLAYKLEVVSEDTLLTKLAKATVKGNSAAYALGSRIRFTSDEEEVIFERPEMVILKPEIPASPDRVKKSREENRTSRKPRAQSPPVAAAPAEKKSSEERPKKPLRAKKHEVFELGEPLGDGDVEIDGERINLSADQRNVLRYLMMAAPYLEIPLHSVISALGSKGQEEAQEIISAVDLLQDILPEGTLATIYKEVKIGKRASVKFAHLRLDNRGIRGVSYERRIKDRDVSLTPFEYRLITMIPGTTTGIKWSQLMRACFGPGELSDTQRSRFNSELNNTIFKIGSGNFVVNINGASSSYRKKFN